MSLHHLLQGSGWSLPLPILVSVLPKPAVLVPLLASLGLSSLICQMTIMLGHPSQPCDS